MTTVYCVFIEINPEQHDLMALFWEEEKAERYKATFPKDKSKKIFVQCWNVQ